MTSPHSPDRPQHVRALFEALVDLPPDQREKLLELSTGEDLGLKEEVASLLHQADQDSSEITRVAHSSVESVQRDGFRPSDLFPDEPASSALHDAHLIGSSLSHFEILSVIARGGMGVVYRARDTILGRSVALKLLPAPFSADESAKKRFIHEAQTASALEHPNIATIYEIGETPDGRLFIAMAFYEGQTLQDQIQRGPLSLPQALDTAIQLVTALVQAHRRDIVHRDVKPGNVIITTHGTVKLLDFGLAKFAGESGPTQPGQMMGTVAYMSPEQVEAKEIDARTDIWSAGVVLYEMLAGSRPFGGDTIPAAALAILHGEPAPIEQHLPDLPPDVVGIIRRCLRKAPADRYPDSSVLLEDLKSARDALAPTQPTGARRRVWARPSFKRFAMLAAALGVAVVGYALFQNLSRPPYVPATPPDTRESGHAIAVLPLANLSPDPENAFFAGGVHEDILSNLAAIAALKVISRTSVLGYADKQIPLPQIAEELGVRYIVEGSVRRAGDRVRISVQLIDARSDQHLWAESYDRDLIDVFQIQSEVAKAITLALHATLSGEEETQLATFPTRNIEAYDAFIQARELLMDAAQSDFNVVRDALKKATDLDPLFLDAWVYQAYHYSKAVRNMVRGFMDGDPQDMLAQARRALDQAIRIDPDHPETHFAQACFFYYATADYERALRHFDATLLAQPSHAEAASLRGFLLSTMERYDEAQAQLRIARELNPRDLDALLSMAVLCEELGQYGEAQELCRQILSVDPLHFYAFNFGGYIAFYLAADRTADPEFVWSSAHSVEPGYLTHYSLRPFLSIHFLGRNWEEISRTLEELEEWPPEASRYQLAYYQERAESHLVRMLMARERGEPETARDCARQAIEELTPYLQVTADHPPMQCLLSVSMVKFYLEIENREAAQEAYQRLLKNIELQADGDPNVLARNRLQHITALAELDPDAAVHLLVEEDTRPLAKVRIPRVLAEPYNMPGIFRSARMQQLAREHEGGRWIPHLTRLGFLE